MKKFILPLFAATLLITSCNIKQTEEGALPDVDVDIDAEAGNLPEYDVNWADVDIKTTTRTVEVPKVVVVMEEEEIEVPVIDVDMPGEKSERTLLVETEVYEKEAELDIKKVVAVNNKLYVIATLEEGDQDLDGKKMRIQDQVDLNAPAMDVEYIIVGKRPNRAFNKNNSYINSMNDLNDNIKKGKVIYED